MINQMGLARSGKSGMMVFLVPFSASWRLALSQVAKLHESLRFTTRMAMLS